MNNFLKLKKNLDSINRINIVYIFLSGFILFFLSNGEVTGVTSDFDLYFSPINNFYNSDCDLSQCLKYFLPSKNIGLDQWVPTPFYSIFFLLPISLFRSNFLFLIQGVFITLLIFLLIKNLLEQFYNGFLEKKVISLIILLGFLNYYFIKDSLTSGTMSVCFLFILLAIYFREKSIFSLLMLCFASLIRSNYIFMSLSFLIALFFVKPRNFKKYFFITFLSIIFYMVNYKFFYSSYPGSPFIGIFKDGMHSSQIIADFFESRLKLNSGTFYWEPNLFEVINLIFRDFSLLYGIFINYIFKIMSMLGFMHYDFFIDERSLWFQRTLNMINFAIIYTPAFYFSIIMSILIPFYKLKLFSNFESLFIYSLLLYIFLHSTYLGQGRYLIGYHFIMCIIFVRIIRFSLNKIQEYKTLR